MGRLQGRVAIVTGGASGIGKAIAGRLAQDGAKVVVADVQRSELGALNLQVDVSKESEVARMASETMKALGRIDILVNNAAIFSTLELRPFEAIPVDEFRRLMEVNIMGVWLCCRACAPHMRTGGYGRIVNLASGAPLKGVPLFLHYIAS